MSPREDTDTTTSQTPPTIDLIFKVWAPHLNRCIHRLFLLGSLKVMGAWNIKNALEAYPTSDIHTWKVDIRGVPIKSSFEWTWLRARPDKSDVKWERMIKRYRTVDSFGGVIHTIYGDGEDMFIQSATSAEVSTYRKVKDGQIMILTGSSYTTGAWDLKRAARAIESPRQSGYWKANIAFDSNTTLYFKWAIVREKDRMLNVIEKENHAVFGRQAWLRVVAPWNLPRIFIVDTPVCLDPMDHVMGRTDVLISTKKMRSDAIRKWLKMDPKLNTPDLVPINQVPYPKPLLAFQSVPTKTNQEKAREAFIAMAVSTLHVVSSLTPVAISGRTPTVQPLENVDDHAKKRAEALSRIERQPKQQPQQQQQENKAPDGVYPMKGKGQTLVAKTSGHQQTLCNNSTGMELYESCLKDLHHKDLRISSDFLEVEVSELTRQTLANPSVQKTTDHEKLGKSPSGHDEDEEEDSGFETTSQRTQSDLTMGAIDKKYPDSVSASQSEEENDDENPYCLKKRFNTIPMPYDMGFLEGCWDPAKERKHEQTFALFSHERDSYFEEDDDYLEFVSSRMMKEELKFDASNKEKGTEVQHLFSTDFKPDQKGSGNPFLPKYEILNDFKSESSDTSLRRDSYSSGNVSIDDNEDEEIIEEPMEWEYPDLIEKRSIARILEEQWGAYKGDGPDSHNGLLHNMKLSSAPTYAPTFVSFQAGGNGDLFCSSKEFRIAQYLNTEPNITITPAADNIDHRAIARELEWQWGESYGKAQS